MNHEQIVKPSVGRIVHYVSYGTPEGEYGRECRAAIVTEVVEPYVAEGQPPPARTPVSLAVINPAGVFFDRSVMQDDGRAAGEDTTLCHGMNCDGGTWHWPVTS